MAAPAYSAIDTTIITDLLGITVSPGSLVGSNGLPLGTASLPKLPVMNPTRGATVPGTYNLVGVDKGTASAAVHTIDLTTMKDINNFSINFATVNAILIYNLDSTASHVLTYDATVSNALSAPLHGITTAKADAGPGLAVGSGVANLPLCFSNWNPGWTVDSTHKLIPLDPGANTINYLVYVLGIST